MVTINQGKPVVEKLLGKQRAKDTAYRLMKYTLCEECQDGILLHNCITGCLVFLSKDEADLIRRRPVEYSDELISLVEQYFLVPVQYDEKATVDTLRKMMRSVFTPYGINGYTIMTTTNCNARCFYCYQANYRHVNMSEKTAKHLVEYMIKHKGKDALHIQWFGGEPLVGITRIDQISNELISEGIDFSSSMISNGYLFTKPIIERAVKIWKLRNVQVTLDGTEDIYNRTKSYIAYEESPFRRVLRNINLLLNHGIRVGIRLNLDQHNVEDLRVLVSEIDQLIPSKKYLSIYAHVIYENEGYEPIVRDRIKQDELFQKQFEINKMIFDAGMCRQFYSLPSLKSRSCMADNPRSVVVYPDGSLYNCEHTAEGDCFGHIDTSILDESILSKFVVQADLEMCSSCPLYPSCLILKECEGVKARNAVTCEFEVRMKSLALKYHHERYLSN